MNNDLKLKYGFDVNHLLEDRDKGYLNIGAGRGCRGCIIYHYSRVYILNRP